MIRVLGVARRGAMKARVAAGGRLCDLVDAAPNSCATSWAGPRPPGAGPRLPDPVTRTTARSCLGHQGRPGGLARRWHHLQAELDALDVELTKLVGTAAPALLALPGIGLDTAGQLLVTAGDNPGRLGNEAAFARLCGLAPLPASSGRTDRHRLNRGGDRHANHGLWRITLVRMHGHTPTKIYVQRRTNKACPSSTSRAVVSATSPERSTTTHQPTRPLTRCQK